MAQAGADPRQRALPWQEWSYSTATPSCSPPSPLQGKNRVPHSGVCLHHGSLQQSSPNFQDAVSPQKRELNLALSIDWGNFLDGCFLAALGLIHWGQHKLLYSLPSSPGLRDCGKEQTHELKTGGYKDIFKARNPYKEEKGNDTLSRYPHLPISPSLVFSGTLTARLNASLHFCHFAHCSCPTSS